MGGGINCKYYENTTTTRCTHASTSRKRKESGHGDMDGMMMPELWENVCKGNTIRQENDAEGCLWCGFSTKQINSVASGVTATLPQISWELEETQKPLGIIS
jgi:hypothetical protein